MKNRCPWSLHTALETQYHDEEWGVPIFDDQLLFEYLMLEGAQAGLSWSTILKKRENYRLAFDNFDANIISTYDHKKIDELLQNEGIIRNKLKVNSVVSNAKLFLSLQKSEGSFSNYIWSFVDGKPIQNNWKNMDHVPAKTDVSEKLSKSLKKIGFKFVGPTICCAFMQATGMVNDHI